MLYSPESLDHAWSGLEHLEYARNLLLRTRLVERFEQAGWAYGDEAYTGVPDYEVFDSQLNSVLYMIAPGLAGDIDHVQALNDGREEWWRGLLREDGKRIEDPDELFGEGGDEWAFILTITGRSAALVSAYRDGLKRLKPNLRTYQESPEPPEPEKKPPVHPAGRRTPSWVRTPPVQPRTRHHFAVLMDLGTGSTVIDHPYELFDLLVTIWLEKRDRVRRAFSGRRRPARRGTRGAPRRVGRRRQRARRFAHGAHAARQRKEKNPR